MKKCGYRHCTNEVTGLKKYCCDRCKSFENWSVAQDNKGKPPKYKRTKDYFYMSTGSQLNSLRGQGRRSGGMVKGGMGARISMETQEIAEVNIENLKRHFAANNGFRKNVKFCDETYITKEEAIKIYNL